MSAFATTVMKYVTSLEDAGERGSGGMCAVAEKTNTGSFIFQTSNALKWTSSNVGCGCLLLAAPRCGVAGFDEVPGITGTISRALTCTASVARTVIFLR